MGALRLTPAIGALLNLVGFDTYTILRRTAERDGPLVAHVPRQVDLFTREDATIR